ncbi:MAG TPA: hypothetical protein VMV44_06575 [Rectinemataceae bacterium]|nr:hypothetical protein [Rectinemataceae bacterium]
MVADPWLWLLPGAFFLGAGAGLAFRAVMGKSRRRGKRSARLSTLAMSYLAIAVLAGVGLLVFPDKGSLGDPLLLPSGLVVCCLGLLAALLPRALGIPMLVLAGMAVGYAALCLEGWLPIEGARRIATLTPFAVTSSGWQGELMVEEKDTVPIIQHLAGPGGDSSLVVERLELAGPLALLGGAERYRIVGIAATRGGSTSSLVQRLAPASRLLDLVLPLGESLDAEAAIPFGRRWREHSLPRTLEAFGLLRFTLDPRAPRGEELDVSER